MSSTKDWTDAVKTSKSGKDKRIFSPKKSDNLYHPYKNALLKKTKPSTKDTSGGIDLNPEKETDPHRLDQRQKQIDFGTNTIGFQRYQMMVDSGDIKKDFRMQPPDKHQKTSKRRWDGMIKAWRIRLHKYDFDDSKKKKEEGKEEGKKELWADMVEEDEEVDYEEPIYFDGETEEEEEEEEEKKVTEESLDAKNIYEEIKDV